MTLHSKTTNPCTFA